MALELGIDLGCRRFGERHHRSKTCLIMDIVPYRYQVFISDIAGQDIYAHHEDIRQVVTGVRNWLSPALDPQVVKVPSGAVIHRRYVKFQAALPTLCAKLNWDVKRLQFVDFSYAVAWWLSQNPLR